MFILKKEQLGSVEQLKVVNKITGEYYCIIPTMGAMLNGIGLLKNDQVYELLDNCEDFNSLITDGVARYKGSKLFPFPNRINDGTYSFNGKTYFLKKNHTDEGHAIHGLVYDRIFEVVNFDESNGLISLKYKSIGDQEGYPFQYELTLEFYFSEKGFAVTTKIENFDQVEIPVGDGWHPYFRAEGSINDFNIEIPSIEAIELNSRMIPTGSIKKLDRFFSSKRLDDTFLDTCFQLQEKEGITSIKINDSRRALEINIWMETGKSKYNFVQLYIPPSRNSIAIEPMSCIPNAFNTSASFIRLQPKEKINLTFGVLVK